MNLCIFLQTKLCIKMSDYIDIDEVENKLSIIVRKPQEGKTFICITSIVRDHSKDIHIVLTMNTLASGMQFFGRMEEHVGSKNIIVYNSDKKTAGNCHHAKNSGAVVTLLKKNKDIKVIVCCAHKKRFNDSLKDIFNHMTDSIQFMQLNRKFKIHIDEAHKYIPENRDNVRLFNNTEIVSKIVGYSASPDPIFSLDTNDSLFNSIYICDVEKEYGIIRSTSYFGVKDCEPIIVENEITAESLESTIDDEVPEHIARLSLTEKEREHDGSIIRKTWYGQRFPFSIGDEKRYFSFLEYSMERLDLTEGFSYHFVPAYCRKVTHYMAADIILKYYNNANVIVINGNGIQLFRYLSISGKLTLKLIKTNKQIIVKDEEHQKQLLEPSFVIQELISDHPNSPTFVTGLVCVGMSVTLVNEVLGNFDSIIMLHNHYNKESLYQLCRFLFNYAKWSPENISKIKKTKFICMHREVYDICLDYESYIEKLTVEYSGRTCALNDVRDIEIIPPTESAIRKEALKSIEGTWGWKEFEVDGDDEDDAKTQWERAEKFYKNKTGKDITKRSKPSRVETDPQFLTCSINGKKDIYTNESIRTKIKGNKTWDSYFQLLSGKTRYASRMFIGYDDINDSSKYIIYIKWATLEETEKVYEVLDKYGKSKRNRTDSNSSIATSDESVVDSDSDDDESENN
jgi:hypothetical protein